jgi:hypothetical protein
MNLTYRGHRYQAQTVQSEAQTNLPQLKEGKTVKLIYRGNIFERSQYVPPPLLRPLAVSQQRAEKAIKLIYRGQTFDYVPTEPQPYCRPRAINWRFQYK